MGIAHARSLGWPVDSPQWVTVGTMSGAVEAFAEDRADVFFWERVMTQPLVDAGRFRRVGIFAAPWPAFVLCINHSVAAADRARIEQVFDQVLEAAAKFKADLAGSSARIEQAFDIARDDAALWLTRTQWANEIRMDKSMLREVAEVLIEAGVIESIPNF
jgi:hypothetical protein